jgi:hypothetical protein
MQVDGKTVKCVVCDTQGHFKMITTDTSSPKELICGQCGSHVMFVDEEYKETKDKILIE